jgi:hypothetical protein
MGVRGYARPIDEQNDPQTVCANNYAFCFRLGRMYRVTATAYLKQEGVQKPLAEAAIPAFNVIAPARDDFGYVRFDRRAFVKNKTALTFGANGLVSGFSATNPSEVLGFFALPTAVAAGFAAGVALR